MSDPAAGSGGAGTQRALRLLAIEAATEGLSVAVFEGGRVVAEREARSARQHAASLLAIVDETLRAAGIGLPEIEAMAISAGPGSFTSLRISLATLKGLCFGRSIPVVGVSTLETIAMGAGEAARARAGASAAGAAGEGGPEVLALLDARRGEWYAGAWRIPAAPGALPQPTLIEGLYAPTTLVLDLPRAVFVAAPEPGACAVFAAAGLVQAGVLEEKSAHPRAAIVGRLALPRLARGEGQTAAALTARYLRRAEAEARRTGQAVEAGETARTGPL